jgi:hypothetical protein
MGMVTLDGFSMVILGKEICVGGAANALQYIRRTTGVACQPESSNLMTGIAKNQASCS